MTEGARLFYVHDPMCSWCWGFRPTLEQLLARLPKGVTLQRLLGGLAPDNAQVMPLAMQLRLQETWRQIQARIPGTPFNFAFWQVARPRRSTWPACRAVLATRAIAPNVEPAMILAIQQAYYLEARNPADDDTLITLARRLDLDSRRFAGLLNASDTQNELASEMAAAEQLGIASFPALCLQIGKCQKMIAIDYLDPGPMLEAIQDACLPRIR